MLETNRLTLDTLQETDAAFILELLNSPGWLSFIGDRQVYDMDAADAYVKRIQGMSNVVYWVVRKKGDAYPIGTVSFIKRDYLEDHDIGFAFLPQHHGMGYAQEAAAAVIGHVRNNNAHPVLVATVMQENLASIRLLSMLGFNFQCEIEVEGKPLHLYRNERSIS